MASWWNTVKRILRSEAADAKDEFDKLRQSIDRELTRKERELEATPAERVEMILEEIDAGDGRLDEIADDLESRVQSGDGAPDLPVEGSPGRSAPRARLLVPADVSSSPLLGRALTMVLVDDPDHSPLFDHQVLIAPEAGFQIDVERLAKLQNEVNRHALVIDVASITKTSFLVNAPGLHHEDVRLIAAAALTNHLEGREQPGDGTAQPPSDA